MSRFVVTGALHDSSSNCRANVPDRLEINDFVKNEEMFSLYIQALDAMTRSSQEDLTSFFQIGGIHGLPYAPWNSTGEDEHGNAAGYCTHGSVLFPTWHRPYVALFEQVLQIKATEIANTYAIDSNRWQETARNLRQPYWDWAKNSVPPPEVISLRKISIIGSDGLWMEVDNPFLRYRFHPVEPTFQEPFNRWSTTLRRPTSVGFNAEDNVTELIDLRADQLDLTSKTYNMLMRINAWPAFSNHTPDDGGSASNSLEAIHDAIHVSVGGSGHMGDPGVAAFDPIFYLHHSQIDRLLAMWRALHPDVWVSEAREEDGTYTISPGAVVDQNTPLAPFWNTQTSLWTSSDISEAVPSRLGYSYPEFNNLDLSDQDAVRARIAQIVKELYGPSRSGLKSLPLAEAGTNVSEEQSIADVQPLAIASSPEPPQSQGYVRFFLNLLQTLVWSTSPNVATVFQDPPSMASQDEPDSWVVVPQNSSTSRSSVPSYWEWTARIRVKKYELGGSFSVLLFLGTVPDYPAKWRTSPSYVGAHHAFVNSTPQRCANCRRQKNLVIEGFVHLDEAIAAYSGPSNAEHYPDYVKPYLQERMQWRVQKADGMPVPLEDVPSLEVTVVATRLYQPAGAVFPVSEEAVFHDDISFGREPIS